MLRAIQAEKDAAGDIDWLVSVCGCPAKGEGRVAGEWSVQCRDWALRRIHGPAWAEPKATTASMTPCVPGGWSGRNHPHADRPDDRLPCWRPRNRPSSGSALRAGSDSAADRSDRAGVPGDGLEAVGRSFYRPAARPVRHGDDGGGRCGERVRQASGLGRPSLPR
jgi:hypothetical protein